MADAAPHVVVVEDNVEASNLLRDGLRLKYQVTCFPDGEAVLRLFPVSEEVLVFLLDYNLPGDNGIVLKEKLAIRFPRAGYILISGLLDEKLSGEAASAGFHGTLPKPFGMAALGAKVEEVLGLMTRPAGN
jgi:DNA-binding NtrC family response regulator